MGRRSLHSPEELRQLILQASREIVDSDGMQALSARAIAKRIGYSPGTLYNVFKNLDDLLLTIELALAEEALSNLQSIYQTHSGPARLRVIAQQHLDFALGHRKLWNLLFQHTPPPDRLDTRALQRVIEAMAHLIKDAVVDAAPTATPQHAAIAAETIWFGLQGLTALAVSERQSGTTSGNFAACALMLVDGVLAHTAARST